MTFGSLDNDAFAKPSEELAHFTNREKEQDIFRHALEAPESEPPPLIMFYGVGGAGKSCLLKRLRQQADQLPTAYVDLDPRFGSQAHRTDPSRVLGDIRRQLGASVRCPRFDLAYTWLRYKEGLQDEPNFRGSGVLGNTWEFVVEAGDAAASDIPGASLVTWLVGKVTAPVRDWLNESGVGAWLATKLGQEDFVRLKNQLPAEIYPQLHRRLLADLSEHLPDRDGRACRAVVFVDTVEAIQGQRDSAERLFDAQQWLRDLYHPDSRLLVVLAGRDRLSWDRDPDSTFADTAVLEQHLIGGLSETDARDFLTRCTISDPALQHAILRVCEDTESSPTDSMEIGYHAFSLGLCADTCWALNQRGETIDASAFDMTAADTRTLAARFLRSLGGDGAYAEWLKRLALTIRFDESAARACFSPGTNVEQDFAWRSLAAYSFVRPAEESGWMMLHARMRDALNELEQTEDTARWRDNHEWWRNYWSTRPDSGIDRIAAAAWHHAWKLDPTAAQREWNDRVETSRAELRMADHYALLTWWEPCGLSEIQVDPDRQWGNAAALNDWGTEYGQASLGDRDANLRRAIDCYEYALRVYTEDAFPQDWAMTQNNLALTYADLPSGDRDANLRRAIDCYEYALRVYTEDAFPQQWAVTQNNLANAYRNLPSGDRDANLRRAIDCFENALRVLTEDAFPQNWAMTQNNLANAHANLPSGDRNANLRRAVDCYEYALCVYTEDAFPQDWAMTQNNLANAYANLPSGDRDANLRRAIERYENALRVRTEDAFPQDWAMTQNNLANTYASLPSGDRDANLRRAIERYENALRVRTEDAFPQDWAMTQNNLANTYASLPSGDRDANLRRAIERYENALRVYTEDAFPNEHAQVLRNRQTAKDGLTSST